MSNRYKMVLTGNHAILEFHSLDGSSCESNRSRDVMLRDARTLLDTAAGLDAARDLDRVCRKYGVNLGDAIRDEVTDESPVRLSEKDWNTIRVVEADREIVANLERMLHRLAADPNIEKAMITSWWDYESIERTLRGAHERVQAGLVGI